MNNKVYYPDQLISTGQFLISRLLAGVSGSSFILFCLISICLSLSDEANKTKSLYIERALITTSVIFDKLSPHVTYTMSYAHLLDSSGISR